MDARLSESDVAAMASSESLEVRTESSILRGIEHYAAALAMVAASTLLGLWIAPRFGNDAVDMIYLPSVLAAAALWGLGPGLVAGVAAVLAYNFFFTEPYHTLRIDRVSDIVTVVVLLIVAIVTSRLAAGIRRQARIAEAHAARNATIAGFAGRLLRCSTEKDIAEATCEELRELFDCNAMVVSGVPTPEIVAAVPEGNRLTPSDMAAAALAMESGEAAGRGTSQIQPAEWVFYPIHAESRALAAAGLARDDGMPPVVEDQLALLTNLLDQVALALERARAETDRREVTSLRDRDRIRSALLSSVGHDLRTPLTAIIAGATELRRTGGADAGLAATIGSEAGKLERYISNLLDMARIESGAVKLKVEPVDLVDAVSSALRDVRPQSEGRDVEVDIPGDLPLVRADPQLLHHCLINLLDNALRHSDGSAVRVMASFARDAVKLTVEDEGPGLPQEQERPLDVFSHVQGSDRKGGAGLGLAIVKAFAEAMGAKALASNRKDGSGADFTLRFPSALIVKAQAAADAG